VYISDLTSQMNTFIHSFIPDIPIAPFLVNYYSDQRHSWLQHWYCVGVNMPKHYWRLWVKDLPKVPTWRLEWDSNLQPTERKAPNLPALTLHWATTPHFDKHLGLGTIFCAQWLFMDLRFQSFCQQQLWWWASSWLLFVLDGYFLTDCS